MLPGTGVMTSAGSQRLSSAAVDIIKAYLTRFPKLVPVLAEVTLKPSRKSKGKQGKPHRSAPGTVALGSAEDESKAEAAHKVSPMYVAVWRRDEAGAVHDLCRAALEADDLKAMHDWVSEQQSSWGICLEDASVKYVVPCREEVAG